MSLTNEDKEWINAQLSEVHEKIERVETTLLTEFHVKWASPADLRAKSHSGGDPHPRPSSLEVSRQNGQKNSNLSTNAILPPNLPHPHPVILVKDEYLGPPAAGQATRPSKWQLEHWSLGQKSAAAARTVVS